MAAILHLVNAAVIFCLLNAVADVWAEVSAAANFASVMVVTPLANVVAAEAAEKNVSDHDIAAVAPEISEVVAVVA